MKTLTDVKKNQVKTVETHCPDCGVKLNRASFAENSERIRPEPGDLSVCFNCGAILVFINSAGDQRRATPEDMSALSEETRAALCVARETVLWWIRVKRFDASTS